MNTRHYGLEIDDKVKIWYPKHYEICEVIAFSRTDNNRCILKDGKGKTFMRTCESCEKIKEGNRNEKMVLLSLWKKITKKLFLMFFYS